MFWIWISTSHGIIGLFFHTSYCLWDGDKIKSLEYLYIEIKYITDSAEFSIFLPVMRHIMLILTICLLKLISEVSDSLPSYLVSFPSRQWSDIPLPGIALGYACSPGILLTVSLLLTKYLCLNDALPMNLTLNNFIIYRWQLLRHLFH